MTSEDTILLVGDDEVTAELGRQSLSRAGLRVQITGRVTEAVTLLERNSFTAVILDYHFPEGDPWTVVEAATAKVPRIPVIIATATGNEAAAAQGVHHGVVEYVRKGNTFSELLPGIVDRVRRLRIAEDRLQRTTSRFETTARNASDIIAVCSLDGSVRYISGASKPILGYEPEELIGAGIELAHPDDQPALREFLKTASQKENAVFANRCRRKDGSFVWLEHNVTLLREPAGGAPSEFVVVSRDITERKRAEEAAALEAKLARSREIKTAVRASEERFRAMFERAAIGLCEVDSDGRFLLVNDRLCEIVGYSREELTQKTFGEITHPDDLQNDWHSARAMLRGDIDVYSREKRYFHKNGSIIWVNLTSSLVRDENNAPDYFVSIIEDITARKAAEDRLKQAERRYRWLVESNPAGLVETGSEGQVLSANNAFFRIIGWDREAFAKAGMDLFKVTPDEWKSVSYTNIETSRRTGKPVIYEKEYVRQDGSRVPVMIGLSFLEDSNDDAVAFVLDLTEQKRAERGIRESEAQFRALANAMPQLCWMANADGWIFWYNQRWYDYTGTGHAQMEGWGWQSTLDPEALPSVMERWKASLSSGEPFDMVFPLRGADGVFRPFLTRILPVRDQEGRIVRWFGTNTDISEQRRTEQALRDSEAHFAFALEAAQLGAWDLDLKRHTAWRSLHHDLVFGYPDLLPEWTYEIFLEHVLPEDREEVDRKFREAVAKGEDWEFECRIRRADGATRWIWARGRSVSDEHGERQRMSGVMKDITNQKREEEARRLSEERFRIVVESSPGATIMVAEDGRIKLVNAQTEKLFGYPREELLGQVIELLIPHRFRSAHPGYRAGFLAKPSGRSMGAGHDLFGLRKDGSEVPIEIGLSPIKTGEGQFTLVTITDITERKEAEAKIRESERQIRRLADAMPQIVWTATPDGVFDYYNERWYEFTGLPRSQQGNGDWLQNLHPNDAQRCLDAWRWSVASVTPFEVEYRFWDRQSSSWRWFLGRALPIRDESGRVTKWAGTCTDIDERKRISETLDLRVQERTQDLERSLHEKETLLKEVHHRVKNNLQVICSLLALQIETYAPGSAAALQDAYDRVHSMALIHEKLYQSATVSDVDFGAYIEILARQLMQAYAIDPARIRMELSVEPIPLPIDQAIPSGLILNELVSNSLKHAFPAGRAGVIEVAFKRIEPETLMLRIADNGIGLPASFSFDTTTSLGLQVVETLVRQLRGELQIGRDGGTQITITWSAEGIKS
ncbi:MAG TPA: PAS domain S-box protein [Bryobacteraceae bacterium]